MHAMQVSTGQCAFNSTKRYACFFNIKAKCFTWLENVNK
jgi:hypothetical protein